MKTILEFQGEHRFLSNFWYAPFTWQGQTWPTAEHAYQASKTLDPVMRDRIQAVRTPGEAKRLGKTLVLREDWDEVRFALMLHIVRAKFRDNPELRQKLIDTHHARLEEGNWWNDRYWGVCPVGSGNGLNMLGTILMQVRDEFREERALVG